MALTMNQAACIWPISTHYSQKSNAFSESWPADEPRAEARLDPARTTLPIQVWPPEDQIPIHISYSTDVFPPAFAARF